jgi:ABC-type antimicrobial peptide transport system permease subunit
LIGDVTVLTDAVAREKAPWRFAMRIFTGFGALAAVLSVTGLVGLLSLAVTLRRRELAIRAALGASPARLRGLVLGEGVRLVIPAALVGALVAAGLSQLTSTLLAGVAPHDLVAGASAAVVAVLFATAGALWPARRAAASNPGDALRE